MPSLLSDRGFQSVRWKPALPSSLCPNSSQLGFLASEPLCGFLVNKAIFAITSSSLFCCFFVTPPPIPQHELGCNIFSSHHLVLEGFVCPHDDRSLVVWAINCLVRSLKANSNRPGLHLWGLAGHRTKKRLGSSLT